MTYYRWHGIVYKDGVYSAIVRYDLAKEILSKRIGGNMSDERSHVRGSLVVLQGELPLNEELLLHMEDGREVAVQASQSDNFGTYATRHLAILSDDPDN